MQWATAVDKILASGGFDIVCEEAGKHTSRSLLLAEALHALGGHVGRLCVGRAVGEEVGVVLFDIVTVVAGEVARLSNSTVGGLCVALNANVD